MEKTRLLILCAALLPMRSLATTGTKAADEGPASIRNAPNTADAFSHGPSSLRLVALTFDACSTMRKAGYDSAITRILLETHTPATIFLSGRWVEQWPEATRFLGSNPLFELGNHSYSHPHLMRLNDGAVTRELVRTEDLVAKETGRRPTLFRPPYGEFDSRIVRLAKAAGLTTVEYSLPSGDPDERATKGRLIDYVTRKARAGSIIVMHINGRGWHTAQSLPEIISRLHKRGFVFVKVSDLIAASRETPVKAASLARVHAPSRSRSRGLHSPNASRNGPASHP